MVMLQKKSFVNRRQRSRASNSCPEAESIRLGQLFEAYSFPLNSLKYCLHVLFLLLFRQREKLSERVL